MSNAPLATIHKLVKERYQHALAIFWAGSVAQDLGTNASDLDLVIVMEQLPNAYREAFIYDQWPIDAFIQDKDTLRYFFEESRTGSGISGLIQMVLNGRLITRESTFSQQIRNLAQDYYLAGPAPWSKQDVDKERFLITDVLEDIQSPQCRAEQIASAASLYEALARFYFRAQNKWTASGKSIIRYLDRENPALALEFTAAFSQVFQDGTTTDLIHLVKKILQPYGGFLWDGFKIEASADLYR